MFLYITCIFLAAAFNVCLAQFATNPCNSPGLKSEFLVDPTSCSSFIRCVGKIPQRMVCAPGTLFNTRISMCDHPKNVDCNTFNRPTMPTTTTTPAMPNPTMFPTVPTNNAKMVEQYYEHWYKFYCSAYGSNNVIRWPHPNDCSRFYECRLQQLTAVRCPTFPQQMLYNGTLQNCDLPQRVRCENLPPFGNHFASTSEEELRYRSLCRPGALLFNRWPNSHDCRRFYQCVNGYFTHENCSIHPQQLVYNNSILNCQRPLPGDLCILNWIP